MSRQVTVYEASKNGKITVLENVEANTLGELKSLMRAKDIDIENMDFMEGVSNVILRDDNSVLPSHILYKGSYTDNLFVYLSLKNKKISSGVMNRREAYAYIKDNSLEGEVKEKFGRNFTQVPTDDLLRFIDRHNTSKVVNRSDCPKCDEDNGPDVLTQFTNLLKAFNALVDKLFDGDYLYESDVEDITGILKGTVKKETESVFKEDMDDILSRIGK